MGAPAANAGAGARRVGGRAAISRLNMRLRRPTILPCAPRPRFFFASTRAAGRGQWVARASPPIALPVLAHSKRRLLAVNHRLLTHCRHGPPPLLTPQMPCVNMCNMSKLEAVRTLRTAHERSIRISSLGVNPISSFTLLHVGPQLIRPSSALAQRTSLLCSAETPLRIQPLSLRSVRRFRFSTERCRLGF